MAGSVEDLFIGVMSGTSLDGVDAVLVRWPTSGPPLVVAHVHRPFAAALRTELLALNAPGDNELHRSALAANGVARAYGEVVQRLLSGAQVAAAAVKAIGAHGQTVRHRPGEFDGVGYTTQLLNAALLAECCGIDVVADLRSRDVAAGGQGAPLVPAFHAALFAPPGGLPSAVLNLGGMANLSLLETGTESAVSGFDTGPGNALLDAWCELHTGQSFDADGAWAASGQVLPDLLSAWLAEPYFQRPPPKSTGRDLFTLGWLQAALPAAVSPQDVQATLLELSARTATDALRAHQPTGQMLWVCGGGAFNSALMARLQALLPQHRVQSTAALGVAPDQVEAMAFAWLARAHVRRETANRPVVTGARGSRVLGALYPA